MGVESALGATSGFGRIGPDVLNAQLLERPTHLGQIDLVDFATRLRGVKVMAAPVSVRTAKQPVARNRLPEPVEAGVGALLSAKEHARVLARGIVHRHHQVPHPLGHPLMGTCVLVHHHPRQGLALALLAVLATLLGSYHQLLLLQSALHPAVAAPPTMLALIPCVKVLHVPAYVVRPI